MKKIIAFAGSNSSTSINHQLVTYASSLVERAEVKLIKLTDYPLPIFSEDLEKESGYPDKLAELLDIIRSHDGLIISVNEHNGGISAFFKNILDWLSRIEYKFLDGKKVLCLSSSPGGRGALTALEYTTGVLPRYNGEVVASMPFPSFGENFSEGRITNDELSNELNNAIKTLLESL
ncbi:NAD(P)H-dependent oxidoreductase [Aureitalea sp. L0-47]|uniref:NADPH-dependent FMN reductase n=1 Tax=Aureitalea sp. L0-47 TaxID=2816962 RepID=UPI0022380B26|nr:NADPH-dependent FMN reductase [Aureitalea sp. L0-47]MCW5520607.1 NAD(P)H-dependent oxidoreductase [Aureitalea sp. L0-47]